MRRSITSFTIIIFAVGCTTSSVSNPAGDGYENRPVGSLASSSPTPVVVSPAIQLTKRQERKLESSLPKDVRKLLESASELTLQGEIVRTVNGVEYPVKESFEPNTAADITTPDRKEILEAFYIEASNGEEPSVCWRPHHKVTARSGNAVVEIEICFACGRFKGTGPSGEFSGTFAHGDSPKCEKLLNKILVDQGRSIR